MYSSKYISYLIYYFEMLQNNLFVAVMPADEGKKLSYITNFVLHLIFQKKKNTFVFDASSGLKNKRKEMDHRPTSRVKRHREEHGNRGRTKLVKQQIN